jgi:hypothetical protein
MAELDVHEDYQILLEFFPRKDAPTRSEMTLTRSFFDVQNFSMRRWAHICQRRHLNQNQAVSASTVKWMTSIDCGMVSSSEEHFHGGLFDTWQCPLLRHQPRGGLPSDSSPSPTNDRRGKCSTAGT